MTNGDAQAFTDLLEALAVIPGREVTKPMRRAYWMALSDMSILELQRAGDKWMKGGGKFMPTPNELRELAGGQTQEMRAILAWAAVRKAVSKHDSYATVQFADPAATAAIRSMGGWIYLCEMSAEEIDKWAPKDFKRAYDQFHAHGVSAEMAAPLLGLWARDSQATASAKRVHQVAIEGVTPARMLTAPQPVRELTGAEELVEILATDKAFQDEPEGERP